MKSPGARSAGLFALAVASSWTAPFAAAQSRQGAIANALTTNSQQVSGLGSRVLFHASGYADLTYIDTGGAGSSGEVTLAPIFHLQVVDRLFLETEFELEANDDGDTETAVEYATASWLLNDHAALVAGKFLSPVGYFFQNMHPSWVNKLASAPAGFGHGGAAPLSDVGVQLRGGKTFASGQHLNYAVYYANGPQLGLETMEEEVGSEEMGELDLDVEGSTHNPDGKHVMGARLGWMPISQVELGVSIARGDVVLNAEETDAEPSRSYLVDGVDLAWHPTKTLEFRGEWVRQEVGEASASMIPEKAKWHAWYAQGAYRFGADKWEAVVRHSDSVSPHAEATLRQTAVGLSYLFRPYCVAKLTWEFNDSQDSEAGADRLLLQFAYGF